MEKLKTLVLIPARGNSKSIKKKNLTKINNKTLVENIFEQARKSKIIQKIVCSSENNLIIKHCKQIGLNHILRPKNLSRDTSDVFYTAVHALKVLEGKGEIFDIVIFSNSDLSLLFTVCTVLTEFDLTFGKSSLQKQHKKSTMRNKYSINIYMEGVE